MLRQAAIGGVLLATAIGASALTLGRTRGAALIGQPLEVTIPVRLDQGETLLSLCFEADVFYGDTQLDPARFQVLVEPAAALEANVRIRANAVVDEPVVTVYLKSGCAQKFTRRYVLLSELVTDLPSVAQMPVVPPPAVQPSAQPAPRRTDSSASGADGGERKPRPLAAPAKAAPPKSVAGPRKPAVDTAKPRLRLDPIELTAERDALDKLRGQLATVEAALQSLRASS